MFQSPQTRSTTTDIQNLYTLKSHKITIKSNKTTTTSQFICWTPRQKTLQRQHFASAPGRAPRRGLGAARGIDDGAAGGRERSGAAGGGLLRWSRCFSVSFLCQWLGLRENRNRKPWIFPWNMGFSCNSSLKPMNSLWGSSIPKWFLRDYMG